MKKQGITLIALVVTIIVLLILVGVTLGVILGPDGIIEKAKRSKIDARYGSIMDKVKLRETALEISFERGEEGEKDTDFIRRLEDEGLKTNEDTYEEETKTLTVAGIYTIHIADASAEGRRIWQRIQNLPTIEEYPEMEHMTLKIKTTTSPETVTIPITNGAGLSINWGDSPAQTTVTTDNPSHQYQTAGEYTLKIIGKAANNNAEFGGGSYYINPNIVGIKYWGENDFKYINSLGQNLQGTIPRPSRNSFKNTISLAYLFVACTELTGTIPEDLFINCSNVTNFNLVFSACTGLTGNIPEELFFNCPNIISLSQLFYECEGLTGNIPKKLFFNNTKVESFNYVFNYCKGLTGNIPEKLFSNCTKVTSFFRTFYFCTGLTGKIPATLFSNCTNIFDISGVFCGCTGLTGSIPSTLFFNCPNIIYFESIFSGCTGLTGSIPSTLFSNCLDVENFRYTFSGCTGLTGEAPDLWNTHTSVIYSAACFRNCTGLSNYNTTIPSTWK